MERGTLKPNSPPVLRHGGIHATGPLPQCKRTFCPAVATLGGQGDPHVAVSQALPPLLVMVLQLPALQRLAVFLQPTLTLNAWPAALAETADADATTLATASAASSSMYDADAVDGNC